MLESLWDYWLSRRIDLMNDKVCDHILKDHILDKNTYDKKGRKQNKFDLGATN